VCEVKINERRSIYGNCKERRAKKKAAAKKGGAKKGAKKR
jgi:hypothetical protein